MKNVNLVVVFSILTFAACTSSDGDYQGSGTAGKHVVGDTARDFQSEKVIKFPELQEYITTSTDDKVKVINFWATWCAPCIKELPFIDSLRYTYDPDKVEVLLVSLDFPDQLSKVNKLLQRKKLSSTVWLLDESDPNLYIDKVDPSWTGALPATLLVRNSTDQRIFLGKELTKAELETHINKLLN
ncbi:TlpA disulfide reductase family protein [Telluribacter humicola]|uniref:TlpA disulfide reductase family protein n=1 Tax=Telluribacter humicola TaxID=1720261 RepID=UPI001A97BC9D|nr:TlpA disulfide reductase family protein [Telluribacter humicola]